MNKSSAENNKTEPSQWVRQYADYLYRFAMQRVRDEEHARDLVQDTFLAALEKFDQFKGLSSVGTWLTAILKNKIADHYRKNSGAGSIRVHHFEGADSDGFFGDDGHWLEQHAPQHFSLEGPAKLEAKEFNLILQNCLDKMPVLWMSVFRMKHLDEEDSNNICIQLKITAANFWVIMHRSKLHLRACIEKNWGKR